MNKLIQVNSRKYDGSLHRSWQAHLVNNENGLITLKGEFDRTIEHTDLGTILKGTVSHEYYWLDTWYNVFTFYEPDGHFRNHYCNVNMPPKFKGNILEFVDLDLDLLVDAKSNIHVLDSVEFHDNADRFNYTVEIKSKALQQIEVLTKMIETSVFPFDLNL